MFKEDLEPSAVSAPALMNICFPEVITLPTPTSAATEEMDEVRASAAAHLTLAV